MSDVLEMYLKANLGILSIFTDNVTYHNIIHHKCARM